MPLFHAKAGNELLTLDLDEFRHPKGHGRRRYHLRGRIVNVASLSRPLALGDRLSVVGPGLEANLVVRASTGEVSSDGDFLFTPDGFCPPLPSS